MHFYSLLDGYGRCRETTLTFCFFIFLGVQLRSKQDFPGKMLVLILSREGIYFVSKSFLTVCITDSVFS